MARTYTVAFDQQSFTTANGDYDFFEISPADDKPVEIKAIYIGNQSEVGDAQEEMIAWAIIRGHTTSGSGGAAPTPVPIDPIDAAAGFTAETANSTIASTGTTTTIHADTFNVRTGLQLIFPPDMRPKATQANTTIVVRLLTALADNATLSGTIYIDEI